MTIKPPQDKKKVLNYKLRPEFKNRAKIFNKKFEDTDIHTQYDLCFIDAYDSSDEPTEDIADWNIRKPNLLTAIRHKVPIVICKMRFSDNHVIIEELTAILQKFKDWDILKPKFSYPWNSEFYLILDTRNGRFSF